jgi:hypothetical protein
VDDLAHVIDLEAVQRLADREPDEALRRLAALLARARARAGLATSPMRRS